MTHCHIRTKIIINDDASYTNTALYSFDDATKKILLLFNNEHEKRGLQKIIIDSIFR